MQLREYARLFRCGLRASAFGFPWPAAKDSKFGGSNNFHINVNDSKEIDNQNDMLQNDHDQQQQQSP
ncbi:MAG: hypothetical protein GY821_04895 [Gammaproteobacteria bacterium]|nr:hypothetical protein [Gammaproteobacteria bacterium]